MDTGEVSLRHGCGLFMESALAAGWDIIDLQE